MMVPTGVECLLLEDLISYEKSASRASNVSKGPVAIPVLGSGTPRDLCVIKIVQGEVPKIMNTPAAGNFYEAVNNAATALEDEIRNVYGYR